jgi:hypothetical protein
MLAGNKINNCKTCYRDEASGVESLRQQSLKFYQPTDIEPQPLKQLEVSFDNLCNLACVMCSEEFSTKWQTEKFTHWLEHDCKRHHGRFINIYTDDGGTKAESEKLMEDLTAWRVPFRAAEEQSLTTQDLTHASVLFTHTDLTHNDVIAWRGQFRRYLEMSCLQGIR